MRKHYRLLLLIAILGSAAFAQGFSFGVTGGLPLLDRAGYGDESRPYIVGPSVEVRLHGNLSLEVDALYQRLGTSASYSSIGASVGAGAGTVSLLSYYDRRRGNAWEFPVLAKYYFHPAHGNWQPFLGAGLAARRLSTHEDASQFSSVNGVQQPLVFHGDTWQATVGGVVAAGVRLHTGRISWSPQIRYTRWGTHGALTQSNEASFLLGIHF